MFLSLHLYVFAKSAKVSSWAVLYLCHTPSYISNRVWKRLFLTRIYRFLRAESMARKRHELDTRSPASLTKRLHLKSIGRRPGRQTGTPGLDPAIMALGGDFGGISPRRRRSSGRRRRWRRYARFTRRHGDIYRSVSGVVLACLRGVSRQTKPPLVFRLPLVGVFHLVVPSQGLLRPVIPTGQPKCFQVNILSGPVGMPYGFTASRVRSRPFVITARLRFPQRCFRFD